MIYFASLMLISYSCILYMVMISLFILLFILYTFLNESIFLINRILDSSCDRPVYNGLSVVIRSSVFALVTWFLYTQKSRFRSSFFFRFARDP